MAGLRRHLTVGKSITWRLKKGLPYHQKQSIALAMMMTVARRFETLQGCFPQWQPILWAIAKLHEYHHAL